MSPWQSTLELARALLAAMAVVLAAEIPWPVPTQVNLKLSSSLPWAAGWAFHRLKTATGTALPGTE